jgi:hypothetical protein
MPEFTFIDFFSGISGGFHLAAFADQLRQYSFSVVSVGFERLIYAEES